MLSWVTYSDLSTSLVQSQSCVHKPIDPNQIIKSEVSWKPTHLIWFKRCDYSLCGCNQPTHGLGIKKSPPLQINSCILYCVFKAFIVKVASSNVSKSERVWVTHSVCTTSDWLRTDTCSGVSFWLLGKRRNSSIFVWLLNSFPEWIHLHVFSFINDMWYRMRPDIYWDVPTHCSLDI